MKINIWSDIRCPFCYIGKRKFERALSQFTHRQVEIVWRSFQLDPALRTQPGLHMHDYLARMKGLSREQAAEMHARVTEIAQEVGIEFDFERAVVANSFNGHRLIQLAKARGLAHVAEEHLFKAYFSEGKNIDDTQTLVAIGLDIGLSEPEIGEMLNSDRYAAEVREDEIVARQIGIRGVPFFLFDDRIAVSGAQSPEVFHQALEKAWNGRQDVTVA